MIMFRTVVKPKKEFPELPRLTCPYVSLSSAVPFLSRFRT